MTSKTSGSHLLVILQLTFVATCCYPVGMHNRGHTSFLIFCLLGSILGVVTLAYNRPSNFSVYPDIRPGAALITNGPYRIVRHPMYSALILMMIGIAGYNGHWINYLAAVGLIVVLVVKAQREEQLLKARFSQYMDYATPLKRFIPWLL